MNAQIQTACHALRRTTVLLNIDPIRVNQPKRTNTCCALTLSAPVSNTSHVFQISNQQPATWIHFDISWLKTEFLFLRAWQAWYMDWMVRLYRILSSRWVRLGWYVPKNKIKNCCVAGYREQGGLLWKTEWNLGAIWYLCRWNWRKRMRYWRGMSK